MTIEELLALGRPATLGRTAEVVERTLTEPSLFAELFECLRARNIYVRWRAADAIGKVTVQRPELLQPYKTRLIRLASTAEQNALRWHFALLFGRLQLTKRERAIVLDILLSYLDDRSSIVRTFAMQGLADLAMADASLRDRLTPVIRHCAATGSPAMKARGRKLAALLARSAR
jgi:hypothetical protein